MPRPDTREKILDAYAALVAEDGERAATMDATAARAGVSKGGLLYHFKSKDALAAGVIERFEAAAADDRESMRAAPEGASRYYVRTSSSTGSVLDTSYSAVVRLAGAHHEPALEALGRVHEGWMGLIRAEVGDPNAAEAIMLIGEGLYYHSTLPNWPRSALGRSLEDLLRQVDRLKGSAAP